MNFQDLKKIEKADFYIDLAMRKSRESAEQIRNSGVIGKNRFEKSKKIELARMNSAKDSLYASMDRIVKSFPSIDNLPEFYKELIKVTLDYAKLKKSLGAVNWSKTALVEFHQSYMRKMKNNEQIESINSLRREFFGRATSLIKQIKKELVYLEDARKTMKGYPAIKEMPCIAIAGFPNAGKSTLLSRVTSASPEISNYAFTTKKLNLGTTTLKSGTVQLIDTPGTLNRFEKMNFIERQAYLALKYLAKVIIYVFDPTEQYPLKDQEKLFREIKKYDKPIIVYVSKQDIADKEICAELIEKFHATSFDDLKSEIEKKMLE